MNEHLYYILKENKITLNIDEDVGFQFLSVKEPTSDVFSCPSGPISVNSSSPCRIDDSIHNDSSRVISSHVASRVVSENEIVVEESDSRVIDRAAIYREHFGSLIKQLACQKEVFDP